MLLGIINITKVGNAKSAGEVWDWLGGEADCNGQYVRSVSLQ